MSPESQQLLIASDQRISLMNNESGITLGFWVFENQAQFDEIILELPLDGGQLMILACPNWVQTNAVYWLD